MLIWFGKEVNAKTLTMNKKAFGLSLNGQLVRYSEPVLQEGSACLDHTINPLSL